MRASGHIMRVREIRQNAIRPSATRATGALWAKSLLNAVLFFAIFMVALPWLFHRLLPAPLFVAGSFLSWVAGGCFFGGIGLWLACLDAFSRHGRGTPLPMDAPRELVTRGPFSVVRNPIMAAEVLVIWGEALALSSLGVLLYAAAVTLAAHAAVRHVEEPELLERFGARYEEYRRLVPRWIPRIPRRERPGEPPTRREGVR
jgi:protein-S-isoprenylcysteine O-methyltransferase Ste14